MSELPAGWAHSTIGEVCEIVRGVSFQKFEAQTTPADGLVPILRATNIEDNRLFLNGDLLHVPSSRVRAEQRLRIGDIVLATSSGSASVVGKSGLLTSDWQGAHGAFCSVLRVRPSMNARYVGYLVQSAQVRDRWSRAAAGTNIHNLKKADLEGTPVPVPPLGEQERIVASVEEAFSRLDAAEGSIATALAKLRRLRATLMEAALSGDWPKVQLGDLLLSLRNGCFVSRPQAEPPGQAIFRISAVRPLQLNTDDVRYAPPNLSNADDYRVTTGDLLFTRYSGNPAYVGACAVVAEAGAGILHPDKLIRGVVDRSKAIPEWVALAVSSAAGRHEIERRLKTTAG